MSGHAGKKEAFSRVAIDAQLQNVGWTLTDGRSVRYEYQLSDRTFADYVLWDRYGRAQGALDPLSKPIDPRYTHGTAPSCSPLR